MKLFIFRPHVNWEYCGGARVVIAPDIAWVRQHFFEMEQRSFEENEEWRKRFHGENYFPSVFVSSESFHETDVDGEGNDSWVLQETFDLPNESSPRVVLDDWNHA